MGHLDRGEEDLDRLNDSGHLDGASSLALDDKVLAKLADPQQRVWKYLPQMGPQQLQVVDHVDLEPIGLAIGSGDRKIGHPHPAADHAYHARIGKDLELDHRGVANGDHGGPLAARNVGFHRQQAALSHDHFKSRVVAPQRIDE